MASPQVSQHLMGRAKRELIDFDPNGVDPVDVKWVDMQNAAWFLVGVFHSVGTGTVDTFRILANAASDGSGTDVIIKQHALGTQPDAVGDQIYLECNATEVAQEAADAGIKNVRYVSAQVELGTSTDECVVYYELAEPRFARRDLTADIIT